ncbi:hypothetical protein [Haladaptatus salinisoli]|nr:hypothetical protein [Haladaptatus salinisoli]
MSEQERGSADKGDRVTPVAGGDEPFTAARGNVERAVGTPSDAVESVDR